VTAVTHPAWCDPRFCTATGDGGEHRSEPRQLAVPEWILRQLGGGPWWAYFRRLVTVGGGVNWLRMFPEGGHDGPREISLPMGALRDIGDLVADLLDLVVVDEPEPPRETQDTVEPCQMPSGVEGTACGRGCDRKRLSPILARTLAVRRA
jgi:hypothetical protein